MKGTYRQKCQLDRREALQLEIAGQLRYQQKKIVRRELVKAKRTGLRGAALMAEARRLMKMPMSELNQVVMGLATRAVEEVLRNAN